MSAYLSTAIGKQTKCRNFCPMNKATWNVGKNYFLRVVKKKNVKN